MTTWETIDTLIRIANCPDLPAETRETARECVTKILDILLHERETKGGKHGGA